MFYYFVQPLNEKTHVRLFLSLVDSATNCPCFIATYSADRTFRYAGWEEEEYEDTYLFFWGERCFDPRRGLRWETTCGLIALYCFRC